MDQNCVRELAEKYARCMDDRNFAQLSAVMFDDVVVAVPEFECVGLAAFREQCETILSKYSATMHLLGNQLGDWDGERYEGETYGIATHIYQQDGVDRKWEVAVRYEDLIEGRQGVYKYARRHLNIVWQADQPLRC